MAFNPFAFIRAAGLFPGFAGFLGSALLRVAARTGAVAVASKLAVAVLRTAGLILNRSPVTLGIPLPQGPAARLITGPPTFLNPLGFPGMNSFLAGFAYRDNEELADGWLSFFGELLLSEIPLVDTSVEKAIKALKRGDFAEFGDEAAQALSNDIGLADLAAFFRGVASAEQDARAVGLPDPVASWVFGGITGAVIFLDATFTSIGRTLGGLISPAEEAVFPEADALPLDPGLRRGLPIPTTEEEVRQVGGAFDRFRQRVPDLLRIVDLLKKTVG